MHPSRGCYPRPWNRHHPDGHIASVKPASALKPGVARSLPRLGPNRKNACIAMVACWDENDQRACSHQLTDVFELDRLHPVGDRDTRLAVGVAAFLQHGVVQLPMIVRRRGQRLDLLHGRAQPEPERPSHPPTVTVTYDIRDVAVCAVRAYRCPG